MTTAGDRRITSFHPEPTATAAYELRWDTCNRPGSSPSNNPRSETLAVAVGSGLNDRNLQRHRFDLPARFFVFAIAKGLALLAILGTGGCDRLDMYDQPRYEPLEASSFFSDGRSGRQPVDGTVARGQLREDDPFYRGRENGELVGTIPEAALRAAFDRLPERLTVAYAEADPAIIRLELLRRGQQRFDIHCSPCHGLTGDGDGMIVQRGFRKPPSYHTERLRDAAAGHLFDVITNGFGAMAPCASRIETADRWGIVAYIRALQLSRSASIDDVPEDRRGAPHPESSTTGGDAP